MEPTQLQLVLNVVTITGMTSLAGYCYLLKKENRRLASERNVPKAEVVQPSAKPPLAVEQDIRRFAAGRRTGWVNSLSASLS